MVTGRPGNTEIGTLAYFWVVGHYYT